MRCSVFGTGYLGAVHAAGLAELGFEVVGVDLDATKVDSLNRAKMPFYEPDFEPLLEKHVGSRLRFTTDMAEIADADQSTVILSSVDSLPAGSPEHHMVTVPATKEGLA